MVLSALCALICGLLLSSCGSVRTEPAPDTSQDDYISEVTASRKQLFTGEITYDDAAELEMTAGKSSLYKATVSGNWDSRTAGSDRQVTKVGAQIGVKLTCSGAGIKCKSLSSERQNVLTVEDSAEWQWEIEAVEAGEATLTLTVTAYLRDTDNVLFEKPPIVSHAQVAAAPPPSREETDEGAFQWLKDLYFTMKGMLLEIAALAMAVGAILTTRSQIRRRRTSGGDEGTQSNDAGEAEGDGENEQSRAHQPRPQQTGQPSPSAVARPERPESEGARRTSGCDGSV
ncbi:hypothetical protein [Streptomyces flavidovirens]|uniref:hypothetical protein n=1 Tax=Streptomyces flavidovirens TaxID=67298 RepID=UPI000491D25D|nr:hypothetical protein [Streptomyces flavidovirens]